MNTREFNEKWSGYLEEGHYGLDVNLPEFVQWLDEKFEEFVKVPGFKYSQIKAKFGNGRFYCVGLSPEAVEEVEEKVSELCKGC